MRRFLLHLSWKTLSVLEKINTFLAKYSMAGGENISVTKGVVSRIESMDYAHGAINLPAIQTDAAMNPGNSGGPVCIGNKVVGVAFQTLGHSNNIG